MSEYGHATGLMALRSQLMADDTLADFFTSTYQKPANHIVGLRTAFNIGDYPFICYANNEAVRGGVKGDTEVISVIVGVYDQAIIDHVANGVIQLGKASELIANALNTGRQWGLVAYLGTLREANDLQIAHPTYRKELQVPLNVRQI